MTPNAPPPNLRTTSAGNLTSPTVDPGEHGALQAGKVAVITGAASGIGLAAAKQLAEDGLKIVLADVNLEQLEAAGNEIKKIAGEGNVLVVPTDVSKLEQVEALKEKAFGEFGEVSVLMNNAGIGPRGGGSYTNLQTWQAILDVNLYGVLNVQHVFVPAMIHQENPAIIINTGSKQGITNPPGNAAYNASKAAVKSMTESLAHELRESHADVTAHLFVPGWVYTGLTGAAPDKEKPSGAWTPAQAVQYMLKMVRLGYFYIITPDNETSPELDRLRMQWGADDIAEGRPALSRWHPEFKGQFDEYIKENLRESRRAGGASNFSRSSSKLRPAEMDNYSGSHDNL